MRARECVAMRNTNSTTLRGLRIHGPSKGPDTERRAEAVLRRHRSTSLQLVELVELVEVLENKPETHHQPGTNSTTPPLVSWLLWADAPPKRPTPPDKPSRGREHRIAYPVDAGSEPALPHHQLTFSRTCLAESG